MNGAANAVHGPPVGTALLPVAPGAPGERAAMRTLVSRARGGGDGGARVFGFAAPADPHLAEAVHAAAGCVALLGASVGLQAFAWGLVLVVASAALHAAGLPSAARLVPRRASWCALLRPLHPGTRALIAAPADRARIWPLLPRVTVGALALGVIALALGPASELVVAGLLAALAIVAVLAGRPPRPDAGTPEVAAAEALLTYAARLAARGDAETAVMVAGGTSASGAGVAAALDWYARPLGTVEITLVGLPALVDRPASELARAGWSVRVLTPDDLRSSP